MTITMWAIQVAQTDGLYAAPSKPDADAAALLLNLSFAEHAEPKPKAVVIAWPLDAEAFVANLAEHWENLSVHARPVMAVPAKWRDIWQDLRERTRRLLPHLSDVEFVESVVGGGLTQTRISLNQVERWQKEKLAEAQA